MKQTLQANPNGHRGHAAHIDVDHIAKSVQRARLSAGEKIGLLEWFCIGEYARVEQVLHDMRSLGITRLRTGISWADWHAPQGEEWYRWLLPYLAREVEVLPCIVYTPPSLGLEPRTSSPPRDPQAYAHFIDVLITDLGHTFQWLELWNEPNNLSEWDCTLDEAFLLFAEMAGSAAYWAQQRGKQTVLGGMSPIDPGWLHLMFDRGLMEYIDVVGIHGFPGVWDPNWHGWDAEVRRVQDVLDAHGSQARIWITETGFSTWQYDEARQVQSFLDAYAAPVERVYWYSWQDLDPARATPDGFHMDEREYHFGLRRCDGTPKLLHRLWAEEGIEGVTEIAALEELHRSPPPTSVVQSEPYVMVIGGAGFVGSNLANRLLAQGQRVLVYDVLARPGVERNLRWLHEQHGSRLEVQIADVRNPYALAEAVRRASAVFHFAAQVAVTTSLTNPIDDFEVNARGTVNLLEALRTQGKQIPLLFTSTNKVYGDLADVSLAHDGARYFPEDVDLRRSGISESRRLEFHSPYGCSKGAADQYVLDYAHTYGLPATVFRMSCIYGPRQFGTEDQGWVAHFLIRAIQGKPITIFGDGKQVRDVLFVDDLVDAMQRVLTHTDQVAGQAFNIGGGPANATSLLELIDLIEQLQEGPVAAHFDAWRRGDQRYYVSDTSKFEQATGWQAQVRLQAGLARLYAWLHSVYRSDAAQAAVGGGRATQSHRQRRPATVGTQQERVYGG